MDTIPLSSLNDYLYCERRAHLKLVHGLRGTNEHTLRGDLNHAHADLPGFEHRAGWKLLRALPIWSDVLGFNGKADLVEVREARGRVAEARPVEYKSGRISKWSNDQVQLCAQALCLEEMLGVSIPEGLVFHAKSQRRTTVVFSGDLRELTLKTARDLRELLADGESPPAHLKPQCDGCSLRDICLPEAANPPRSRSLALFRV